MICSRFILTLLGYLVILLGLERIGIPRGHLVNWPRPPSVPPHIEYDVGKPRGPVQIAIQKPHLCDGGAKRSESLFRQAPRSAPAENHTRRCGEHGLRLTEGEDANRGSASPRAEGFTHADFVGLPVADGHLGDGLEHLGQGLTDIREVGGGGIVDEGIHEHRAHRAGVEGGGGGLGADLHGLSGIG